MTNRDRVRITFHGGIVLLVGLFCGYPAVAETIAGTERLWHTAHEGLIMMGMLLLVMSSVFPLLALERREASGLVGSLLAVGYGFMTGLVLSAAVGRQAFGPSRSPVMMTAFIGNAIGILGSFVAASLVVIGARAALTRDRLTAARVV